MATTSIAGGSSYNIMVYGSDTLIAGNGNDMIRVLMNGNITAGSGRDTISVGGNGTIRAGAGNDRIQIQGAGSMSVGGGNDTLTLNGSGRITETGTHGHDTINLGSGNDTIYVQGNATVQSANLYHQFGSQNGRSGLLPGSIGTSAGVNATISGGELEVKHVGGVTEEFAISGKMTLLGGSASTEFVGGTGTTVMRGGSGNDTFIGGSGHDTMIGGTGHNVFEFLASDRGGQHVITNFVSSDQLNVEGHSLAYLTAHNDVTTRDGNTYISIDGGKTTIELQGWTQQPSETTQSHPLHPHDSKFNP